MKKILLIGSDGMLGSALSNTLTRQHHVTCLNRSQFDIAQAQWRKLSCAGYDYVINAAGLINRRNEIDENFYIVNAVFPHVLSALCARQGARLIHFSTDCVFDGINAPFYENSPCGAADLYGRTKALGEPQNALVIRTSIIGPEQKNHYNLLSWTLSQKHINGFTNHAWNGLTTLEAARLVNRIILEALYVEGVRHLYADDHSKYTLIKSICSAFSHDALVSEAAAPQSRDTRLRTRYPEFNQALGIHPMQQQLQDLLGVTARNGQWLKPEERAA